MPTISDEHAKIILEATNERACHLIRRIEKGVPNRPSDKACNKVRCLLFTIRGLVKKITTPLTLAPLVPPTLAPSPLATPPLATPPLATPPLATPLATPT